MEIKNLRITVTGGAGYIGSILVPLLIEKGAIVTVVDDLIFGQSLPAWHDKIRFIKGDLRENSVLSQALDGCQALVHLAAIVGEPACRKDPELASDINIYLTAKINKKRGNIPFVFFSSTSIYGEVGGAICDESTLPTPKASTPYSMHKFKAEKFITPTDNWLIYRPATAFGASPRQRLDILINELTFRAVKDKKIELFNPDFNRTFIHVKDLSQAVIFGLENFDRLKNNIYNAGADELNITKRKIAELLKNKIDFDLTITNGDADPDKRDFIIKYDKIKNAGFTPRISLEQGIDEMIEYFSRLPAGREYYNTSQELTRDFHDKLRTSSYKIRHALLKPRNAAYSLLRRSEKIFKTDMVYLSKGSFWMTSGQIISSLSVFLLSLATANYLSPAVFGTYKYILSIFGILAIFALPGINTAIAQSVARGYDGTIIYGIKTKIKWGLIGSLISMLIAYYYWICGNFELSIAFLIGAFFMPLMESLILYNSYLQGKKEFKRNGLYSIIAQIFSVTVMVIVMLLTKKLIPLLLAYFLSWTVARWLLTQITLKKIKNKENIDKKAIGYGKKLTLINVLNIITAYLDRLLLFHFVGAAEVAIYTVTTAPLDQFKSIIGQIGEVSFPKFAAKSWLDIKKTFWNKMWIFAALIGLSSLIYIIASPFLFKIFFPKYTEFVIYSQIYALSLMALVSIMPAYLMQACKMEKEYYQYNLISPWPQIFLLIFLTYFYGLFGLVLARVINRYLQLLLIIYLLYRGGRK